MVVLVVEEEGLMGDGEGERKARCVAGDRVSEASLPRSLISTPSLIRIVTFAFNACSKSRSVLEIRFRSVRLPLLLLKSLGPTPGESADPGNALGGPVCPLVGP